MAPLPSPEEVDRMMAAKGIVAPPSNNLFTETGQFDLGTVGLSEEIPVANPTPMIVQSNKSLPSPEKIDQLIATKTGLGSQSAILNQFGRGLTLGLFDELQAGSKAAENSLASLFGGGNKKSFGENYRDNLNVLSAIDKAYEEKNPKTALALQLAGGVAPALVSGGVSTLIRAAPKVGGVFAPIAKNLFGVGLKESPTIGQLVKMGAVSGAISGAGEAGPDQRLKGAAIGGAIGSIFAPVASKTIKKVTNVGADFLAKTRPVGSTFGAETGSIGISGKKLSSYTPEELMLVKQLKNTPIDQIKNASKELDAAQAIDSPLFLPEALNDAKVNRNARMVANHSASMSYAKTAIDQRAGGAADRLTNLFDTISDERNIFEGATNMSKAADDILEGATKAKLIATKPLYDAAKEATPIIESPKVMELIQKDQYLQSAIANVKKSAQNADLPDNSLEVLIQTKGQLRDAAKSAKMNGENNKSRLIQDTLDTLHSEMEKANPQYASANAEYAKLSKGTSELEESKLTFLAALHPDKIDNVGQIFNMQPERITQLRTSFIKAGHGKSFDDGVRAYLQNIVEKSKDGSNLLRKLVETPRQRELLKAALGDSYEKVIQPLLIEQKIFAGKQVYHPGSSTAGNFAEADEFQKGVNVLTNVINGDRLGALKSLFRRDLPDEVAQGLAAIYFNPKKGSETIKRILPLLEQLKKNKKISSQLGKGAGITASRQSPIEPKKKTSIFSLKKNEVTTMESNDTQLKDDVNLDQEFRDKVDKIALNLDADPAHILQVMGFETGGKFSSDVKNQAGSGATGLIQFMPSTAKELTGAETKEAAIKIMESMTPVEQLDYVKKYLEPFKGKLDSIEDLYMAVLYPKAVGKDSEYTLFEEGTKAYWQNRGLDLNDDGKITKAEAALKVKNYRA